MGMGITRECGVRMLFASVALLGATVTLTVFRGLSLGA